MESKSIFVSKTFWVQVVGLVVLLSSSKLPGMASFLKDHFSEVGGGWALINIALRAITKDKVSIG